VLWRLAVNQTLFRLRKCVDTQALVNELVGACGRYGAIRYLKVLVGSCQGQLQALCFWQMRDADAERQLMDLLQVPRVADYLVLVVPMPQPWATRGGVIRSGSQRRGGQPLWK